MGTRAVVVVTGKGRFSKDSQTVRLYHHFDGYPTSVLGEIVRAHDLARGFADCDPSVPVYGEKGMRPRVWDMPAMGYAHRLIAAGMDWGGSSFEFGYHYDEDGGLVIAVFNEPFEVKHYGIQADLEWLYLLDLTARTITVHGGGCDTPGMLLADGPVDPRKYAENLVDEYKSKEEVEIAAHMDELTERGWTINPK